MSTPSHSDSLATGQTTVTTVGPSDDEHPGRPHRGGSVLARIPDVRPHLEDDPDTQGTRRIRVDAASPPVGMTNALLRRDHSSWRVSPRLMAVAGSVVVVLAIAAYIRMRNDSAPPADQADLPKSAGSIVPAIDWQADRRTTDPSHPFGRMNDWRSHDHGDTSQRAPDYFSERPPSLGGTRLSDRGGASEANITWKEPGYRIDSTRRQPASPVTESDFKSNRYESSISTDSRQTPSESDRPIVTDSRVFARLGSEDRRNVTNNDQLAPPRQQSIFPWRQSGQRLSWQRYPDTGFGGQYVPPQVREPSKFSQPRDYRSARSGTTLGDDARGSTYDDPRRGGASVDGRIEPPNYRVRR